MNYTKLMDHCKTFKNKINFLDNKIKINDVLCSIPVVHVPIKNQNFFYVELLLSISSSNSCVIKETKSYWIF